MQEGVLEKGDGGRSVGAGGWGQGGANENNDRKI